jgi:hypothetical protein
MLICPACSTENPDNANFCEECGVKLEKTDQLSCPKCGSVNPASANFCLECGIKLTAEDRSNKPDCPACQSGNLVEGIDKGALGIGTRKTFTCNECGAVFQEKGGKYKLAQISFQNNAVWQRYKGKTLTLNEWTRIANGGVSDAEERKINQENKQREVQEAQALKERDVNEFLSGLGNGSINLKSNFDSPIILKKNEEPSLVMNNISFLESRSVRQTVGGYGGPSFRVAQGVSFRLGGISARSESHEELRKIDQGTLVLTSKRMVFIGSKRTVNIDLRKIIAIEPYKDGIGSQRENKQKTEYFTGTHKTVLNFTRDGRKNSLPINGMVLKAAIMGNLAQM